MCQRTRKRLSSTINTVLCLSLPGAAGVDAAEPDPDLSIIDEVTVVEQRDVSQLRAELARADERVFSLYNDLNSNDSLDMICKKETRIGSQIKHRICKSSFHRQIESDAGSEFLDGEGASSASVPTGHYKKVRENMATLMSKHPELTLAVRERAVLRKRISDRKKDD